MSNLQMKLHQILEFIRHVDIFGQSVTLNINKQKSYTTIFGGISSILIIAILIVFFQQNILSFFSQSEVKFFTETEFSPSPDNIAMNIKNYIVAFSIEQLEFVKNPFFNITVEQRYNALLQKKDNGDLVRQIDTLQLEPCTLEHFKILLSEPGLNFSSEFDQLHLNTWLCPKKDFQFNLAGTYTSSQFDYMRIIVTDCQDQNVGYDNWQPTCATQKERDLHLINSGEFKLQIYQVNSVVNPHSPNQYIQTYLDGEMYFTFIPKKLSRLANLFYRKYSFFNDQSLLPFEDVQEKELIVRQSDDYRDLTELGRDTDCNYALIYLRRSQFSQYINRRFVKIDELLSFLGGFLQIMITGFGIIIIYYNKLSMQVLLSNKLYNFPHMGGNQKLKRNQTFDLSMLNYSATILPSDQEENTLMTYVIKYFEPSKKISLTIKNLINHLTYGLLFDDQDSQIFKRAIEQVDVDLDIYNILYRVQEINKLKLVLFKKSQNILFNFTPKPILRLQYDEELPSRLNLEQQSVKKKQITDLFDAWKEIKQDNHSMQCQQDVNFKLNFELGMEIKELFNEFEKLKLKEPILNDQSRRLQTIQND